MQVHAQLVAFAAHGFQPVARPRAALLQQVDVGFAVVGQAFVRRDETMPGDAILGWAASHGMPARTVDGNDVEAVQAAAARAVSHIRDTGGPAFLEVSTYRLRGHYEPDDQSYVDADELARWRLRDPIDLMRERLLAAREIGEGELAYLQQRVQATLDAGLAFAAASPAPDVCELTTDVYA